MKKIVLALAFLILATTAYSQPPVTPTPTKGASKYTKAYYLEKREANMVRGWILTPTGVALMGLSFALAWGDAATSITSLGTQKSNNGATSGIMAVAGVAGVVIGTISFISAGQNKRRARSMAVGYEQVPLPQQGGLMTKVVPTVGLKVAF
ncbi:hypothetical protein [Rufibacter roseolus]|uniref:hypothetical protein n=1 Tax=Rufibacter roseolus TaxID=2817375 RepID=UPI001B311D5B|nr:hypothetical protein [Rufibacter roseolus]